MANNTQSAPSTRLDRAWYDAATFPLQLDMPIRFDDLDVLWHVNNVAVIALLQEARVHFNREMALPALGDGLRTVVAAMQVEYGAEMTYPGAVEIHSGIHAIGRSSFHFAQFIRQHGQGTVYSRITMVTTDAQGPVPVPEAFRQAVMARGLIRG